jgi:D-cysteine desulfhydrase
MVTRRRVLAAVAAWAAVGVTVRTTGYEPLPEFRGVVLSLAEAHVLMASAEVLLPPDATANEVAQIPPRVDRFLVPLPASTQRDVHSLLALVEHGAPPLSGKLARFTHLPPSDREAILDSLARGSSTSRVVYRGLRDLIMLAYYQQPSTFQALGYGGPFQPPTYDPRGPGRVAWKTYDSLVAPPGALPRGAHR